MKVTVSVPGRFWAFYTALELMRGDYLDKLITSYPKYEVQKYGIPKNKIISLKLKEVIERGWRRLPTALKELYNPQYLWSEIFDKQVARRLPKSDILITYSNFALHSMRAAKKTGIITVLERGSSHMLYQQEILKEEYKKFGIKADLAHPKIIDKELREYEEADYVIVPSLFVKRTFLEKGFSERKLIHIPFGVDLDQFKQEPKIDNVFRVIFTGGMSLRKGVHYLLQAFSELNLPNSELLLIGSYNPEIETFFKKYKGKYNHIGHVPQAELYRYYSQGSVFVLMSIEEGLALVQPQAMACGLPLICTTNTGGDDIIRDGIEGFVLPIRDVDALKNRLTYLYKNPEKLKQMGIAAKERVLSGFSWSDYGGRFISECQRILVAR